MTASKRSLKKWIYIPPISNLWRFFQLAYFLKLFWSEIPKNHAQVQNTENNYFFVACLHPL